MKRKATAPPDGESPFITAVKRWAGQENDPRVWIVLSYLAKVAVGRDNAVPLNELVRLLAFHGFKVDARWIQHNIIVRSREARDGAFIGSGHDGIYLIAHPTDTAVMARWYKDRLASENAHLQHLRRLTVDFGWPTPEEADPQRDLGL